jgi:hypothetical protein
MVALQLSVKNLADSAQQLVVSPCHLYSRGARAVPEIECQAGSERVTLQPGMGWSMKSHPKLEGPAGTQRLEVQAVLEPSIWIGLDVTLAQP